MFTHLFCVFHLSYDLSQSAFLNFYIAVGRAQANEISAPIELAACHDAP
jgi:hypothetical protein